MVDFVVITLILLFIAALTYRDKSTARVGIWMSFGLLFILFAFRASNIGNDTHSYIRIFNKISLYHNAKLNFDRFEPGYIYLNYLLKLLCNNAQIVFIVTGAFIYYSFARFILKYSKIPWLSLFLFFTYGFFSFTFSALRQGIAMAICLFAFDALMKGKNIKFALIVIAAGFFHSTAIVFLLALLCKIIKPSGKTFTISYSAAVIMLFAFPILLNYTFMLLPQYEHYESKKYIGETGVAAFLYSFLSSVILFFSYYVIRKRVKTKALPRLDAYGMTMIMLAIVLYMLSIKANIFDRIAIYFNVFAIIVLPNAISLLRGKKRALAIIASVTLFFTYQAVILLLRPDWSSIFPYSFYWQR